MFRYSNCLWRGGLIIHSGLECLNDAKHCRVSTSRKSSFSSSSKASSSSNMFLLMGRKSRSLSELSRKRKVIYGRRPTFAFLLKDMLPLIFHLFPRVQQQQQDHHPNALFFLFYCFLKTDALLDSILQRASFLSMLSLTDALVIYKNSSSLQNKTTFFTFSLMSVKFRRFFGKLITRKSGCFLNPRCHPKTSSECDSFRWKNLVSPFLYIVHNRNLTKMQFSKFRH